MGPVIRQAVESDAQALNTLNQIFNGFSDRTADEIAFFIKNNLQEKTYVAEQDGCVIAFCCVQIFKSFCYDCNYAEITELFVKEDYRRKGIATLLMEFAENSCSDENVKGFQLFTGKNNTNAQKFYEKAGYLKSDEIMYRKRK